MRNPSAPTTAARVVGVVALVSFAVRVVLAQQVTSPFIFQDEGGYLGVARLLVGDAPTLYGPTYLPGYGLLLAPFAAVLEPEGLQRAAQVLNAAAAAATIPVLYLIGRRLAQTPPWLSATAAVVGGTTAASLLQATMLLPESVFALAVLVAVVAVHRAITERTTGSSVLAGAVVGVSYGLHPRGIVVVGAAALVAVVAWRLRVVAARPALALIGVAAAVVVGFQLVHLWATDALYPAGTKPSLAGSPLESVIEPKALLLISLGQGWYLLVASLGLVAFGLLAAVRLGVVERTTPRGLTAAFVAAGMLGSLALGSIASYGVGTGEVGRADQPVYGRYLEQWVPVLIVLAPALVRRWARPALFAVAGLTAVVGWGLWGAYDRPTWELPIAWHNIASLRIAVEQFGRDYVVPLSLLAAVAILLVVGATQVVRRATLWALPLAVVGVVNVWAGVSLIDEWAGPSSEAWDSRHRLGPVLAAAGIPIAIDIEDDFELFYAYNLQFWHPDVQVVLTDDDSSAPAPLIIDPLDSPPVPGAVLVGAERDGDIGLWAVDGDVADEVTPFVVAAGVPAPDPSE